MQDTISTERGHIDQGKILQSTLEYLINNKESLEDVFPDQETKKHTSVVHSSPLLPQKSVDMMT